MLYELAGRLDVIDRMRAEMSEAGYTADELHPLSRLASFDYLNAVVSEGLRLHGAVQSHLDRVMPAGGLDIGGYHLPADTIVYAQAYTHHRDPAVFVDPLAFDPDRWLQPDTTGLRSTVFGPFGYGERSCAGKKCVVRAEMDLTWAASPWRSCDSSSRR